MMRHICDLTVNLPMIFMIYMVPSMTPSSCLFVEEVEVCIELSLKMLKPREIEFSNKLREADDGIIHIRCNIGNYFILLLSAVNIIDVNF